MIWFAIVAALLTAGALLFILVPLLRRGGSARGVSRDALNASVYRDQLRELEADREAGALAPERYEEARREIERRVIEDLAAPAVEAPTPSGAHFAALAAAVAVPLVAVSLYLAVGGSEALNGGRGAMADDGHGVDEQQIVAMVERLAARLRTQPEDAGGWAVLGRSYSTMGRFQEASEAFAQAAARMPHDAQLLADYADALGMAQGRRLDGEPEALIARAMAIDPDNVKARALAGTVAFNRQDFGAAVRHWEHIARIAPDSELTQSLRAGIAEARALAGGKTAALPVAPAAAAARGSSAAGALSGVVRVAPQFAAQVAPTDTVFVFARPAEGLRMPLAIVRAQAKDLPLPFTLDDSVAMTPGVSLAGKGPFVIVARISRTGNAGAQAGDLQGQSAPVSLGASDVRIVISEAAK